MLGAHLNLGMPIVFYEGVGFGGPKPNGLLTGRPFLKRDSERSRASPAFGGARRARASFSRALAHQTPHPAQRVNPCKQGEK